jgi:SSS family solute:Na+ symporter
VILTYSTVGGLKAVIAAEVVEFLLLIVGLPILLAFSVKFAGGAENVIRNIPRPHLDIFNGTSPAEMISLFLTMMIGEALTPAFVQRILIGRDRPTIARATVLSGVISIPVFLITGCVGLCAYAVNSGLDPTLAMPMMVMSALPSGIKGLVITAMLAVVMSSADGCLSSASIGIVNDIIAPLSRRNLKGRTLLSIARVSNVAVGLGAMALALGTKNVFHILVLSYSAWSPMMLVPIAAAILGIRAGKKSFAACTAGGVLTSLIWTYGAGNPLGLGGTTVGFFAGLILFITYSEKNKPDY